MMLHWCGAALKLNGVVEETGLAAGVQGHPAIDIAWLSEKLAPWGETLQPGQIVLAGSFTRPVPARAGDRFEADYGPLGVLRLRFTLSCLSGCHRHPLPVTCSTFGRQPSKHSCPKAEPASQVVCPAPTCRREAVRRCSDCCP